MGADAPLYRSFETYRGVAYPWLQTVYLVAVTVLVADLLVTKPAYTWGSLAVVASGLPFFTAWRRRAGLRSA